MNRKIGLIILAASKLQLNIFSVFKTISAMIPFNGKPLVYQTILNCLEMGVNGPIVVALPESERWVESFLKSAFFGRADIHCCYFKDARPGEQSKTLLGCLDLMNDKSLVDCSVFVVNGDTYFETQDLPHLITNPVAFFSNKLLHDNRYSNFYRSKDGLVKYVEKGDKVPGDVASYIDCGVYLLPSWMLTLERGRKYLKNCTVGHFLVDMYPEELRFDLLKQWEDLGTLSSATKISTKVLGTREFNNLKIDEKRGVICKSSVKKEKILQEINYYQKLPTTLKIYFPRLNDFTLGKEVSYSIEYYPYRTLSEYFVMYELPIDCWNRIFEKIFDIHEEFKSIGRKKPTRERYSKMYIGKLKSRMAMLHAQSLIKKLVDCKSVVINGRKYSGWEALYPKIEKVINDGYENCGNSVIHGDLCFSNILYDPSTNLVRFIDPRGEFYEEGIYGDPSYDIAKLMHSVLGGYDYILHQMYVLKGNVKDGFKFYITQPEYVNKIKKIFINQVQKRYSPKQYRLLLVYEALLFLSMLPLHSDDPKRQVAFYLTALIILGEVFKFDEEISA